MYTLLLYHSLYRIVKDEKKRCTVFPAVQRLFD